MPNIKVTFIYKEQWEAERFRENRPPAVQLVTLPHDAPAHQVEAAYRDAEMIVGLPAANLDAIRFYTKLQLVQTLGAGTNHLPVVELAEMGIRVANNHGGNAVAVAEIAVALMVSTYRHLMVQWDQTNNTGTYMDGFQNHWDRFHELPDKRVGIIGLGQIGSRVAKRLRGWECEVVYTDTQDFDSDYEDASNARRVEWEELLRSSDVITLHVPLNRMTEKLISDHEFELMKPGTVLINTCRGPVVDEPALLRALDSGKLAGAGLDVTEIEPIELDNPLLGRDNVVLLPHRAGATDEAQIKSLDTAILNARLLSEGKDPVGIILPVLGIYPQAAGSNRGICGATKGTVGLQSRTKELHGKQLGFT